MRSYRLLFLFVFLFSVANAQWVEQTSGVTGALYSVSAPTDQVCWIGGAAGTVLRTVDGGTTWANVGGAGIANQDVYAVFAIDASICYITTSPSTGTYIYKTTNGGTTWVTQLTQTGGFGDGIWFSDANTGIFYGDPVGGRWTIFRTTNGGTVWDSTGMYVPSEGFAGWNNGLFMSGTNVWFGTNGTKIWYSTNFGGNWTAQPTTGQVNSYTVWFNSPTVGLTGGTNFMATTNSGTTWSALTVPGTGNISGITGEGSNWWVTRQATSIYASTNNGAAWTTAYTATAGSYYHISKARTGTAVWGVRSNGGITKGYGAAVPVELSSFTASSSNGSVVLDWSTATETNNKGFEIERKAAGTEYSSVAFVAGNGTSTNVHNYNFTDANLQAGKYTYRLKQIDLDGTSSYSKEVEVDVAQVNSFALDQNYPNPFNPTTSISYRIPEASNVVIKVYDVMGTEVATLVNGKQEAGNHSIAFDAAKLSSGSYIYTIKAGNFTTSKKMILMK
ncbi:MAG: T9SS type A sorting domain-containing protein [Ignavibacteria bacterium]|nr:T9SS type A sorting domain-containing protein [Ignavibacteria bacterium]